LSDRGEQGGGSKKKFVAFGKGKGPLLLAAGKGGMGGLKVTRKISCINPYYMGGTKQMTGKEFGCADSRRRGVSRSGGVNGGKDLSELSGLI